MLKHILYIFKTWIASYVLSYSGENVPAALPPPPPPPPPLTNQLDNFHQSLQSEKHHLKPVGSIKDPRFGVSNMFFWNEMDCLLLLRLPLFSAAIHTEGMNYFFPSFFAPLS